MKKLIIMVLLAAMLLVSCGGGSGNSETPKQSYTTKQLVEKITADYSLSGGTYFSSFSEVYGEYLDSDMLLSLYGDMGEVPDMEAVEEYCVYVDGTDPNLQKELGVFKTKDGTDTELFLSFMRSRIAAMLENAKNYPSVDTEPLKNAQFFVEGNYVVYVVVKSDAKDISEFIKDNLD
jgi:hypothetical protein